MGGKSFSSYLSQINDHEGEPFIRFFGVTNTESGGFCSIRTLNFSNPYDISDYKGFVFKARSEKPFKYKFNIRDETGWDSVAW